MYIIDYVVLVTSGSQKEREIRSIGNSTAVKVDNLDWGNVYTVFVYGNFSTLVNVGPPGSSTPETLPNGVFRQHAYNTYNVYLFLRIVYSSLCRPCHVTRIRQAPDST